MGRSRIRTRREWEKGQHTDTDTQEVAKYGVLSTLPSSFHCGPGFGISLFPLVFLRVTTARRRPQTGHKAAAAAGSRNCLIPSF